MRIAKQLLTLVVGIVLAGSALHGQPAEAGNQWGIAPGEAPAPQWRAQWIWPPTGEAAEMLLARKAITLSVRPERAVLSITASSRYELFVNGTCIGRGPARCAPHHQSFDGLDITKVLHSGENVLAKGTMILSTFQILEHLGRDPLADKLLGNLLRYADTLRQPFDKPDPSLDQQIEHYQQRFRETRSNASR